MRGQIYRCTNANRKENLERREENTLCRHGEYPTDQQHEKTNLEQRDSNHGRASERVILDWF